MTEANVRETKDRILDSAERLFALQGIEATSLRQITSDAEVNLAAVNYHFTSKDELVRSVYIRRIRPMNERRLARLSALETNEAIDLDALLDAFIVPVMEAAQELQKEGLTMGQFMGRLYTEPNAAAKNIIVSEMSETFRRFSTAFARVLPHLTTNEATWRLFFTIGIVSHTLAAGPKFAALSQARIDPGDTKEVLRQMKAYATAALTAPSLEATP